MPATTSDSLTRMDGAVSVFAGGFAGVCSTFVTNPLDTIRVRLSASRAATGNAHKSLWYTARDLFSGGVTRGFSCGLGANLLASLPSNAIFLPTYHFLRHELAQFGVDERVRPAFCACGAVCATNLVLAPVFLARTQVQVDDRLTIRQVFRNVMRHSGVAGFYRGTLTNIGGRFIEEGLFWTVYELLKRLTNGGTFSGTGSFFFASAAMVSLTMISKMTATVFAYPYNVIMNHLRTVNRTTGQYEHTRIMPTVRHVYRSDGVMGFYKGLTPQLVRSVISKATQIYAFELVMFTYYSFKRRSEEQIPDRQGV